MGMGLHAFFWGLVSGSALVIGASVGYFMQLPQRLIAGVMAFGCGVSTPQSFMNRLTH